jgi:hypothetical protein
MRWCLNRSRIARSRLLRLLNYQTLIRLTQMKKKMITLEENGQEFKLLPIEESREISLSKWAKNLSSM